MKKTNNFEKFTTKKSNAAIKEQFRQEKRKWKKERAVAIDKKKKNNMADSRLPVADKDKSTTQQQPTAIRQLSSLMPLNKFIAHCGVCARRDAAELVKEGKVKVNGEVITEPGHKVTSKDEVMVNGKKIILSKNLVYILVNKPKDYITTTDDPQERRTVMDLIKNATSERVYPVGRLDRNTSGVLLFTNDGELSQKLTHPRNEIKKIYAVTLDKALTKDHFDQILKGVKMEDGLALVDALGYTDAKDKTQIGIELHGGRNRIVRRIFEHFGYDVKNLDRVVFAGLTKKNLQRGHWRFLSDKELRELKFFGKGK
ncbi:MAG: rRNA pseudouridine synthase [Bacteroidota bacterium]|nr:rRNA pseudouridine synthase [Bacteroidota bacterium]